MSAVAPSVTLSRAEVAGNHRICREHYRLVLRVDVFPESAPGQFVQIAPTVSYEQQEGYAIHDSGCDAELQPVLAENIGEVPFLPRAFSIGGMRRRGNVTELDIIYRVVGVATRWMESLTPGDSAVLIGPLGRPFRIDAHKRHAWLVIGGVGLPPLLWLSESLRGASKSTVAFLGARSRDLLPLTLSHAILPATDATQARPCAAEFAELGADVVISTDDGSLGFHGTVVEALECFHNANPVAADEVAVYTCGPERMMHAAADYCLSHGLECQVCMERSMACGTGTCQSCVVAVRTDAYATGRRYALCCTEGPVFTADQLIWD